MNYNKIKENFKKFLNEEVDKPTHVIQTDVYYIYDFDGFKQEAVPAYEINDIEDMLVYDEGNFLYIDKFTDGWYDKEAGTFTTVEGSYTRIDPRYVRIKRYSDDKPDPMYLRNK